MCWRWFSGRSRETAFTRGRTMRSGIAPESRRMLRGKPLSGKGKFPRDAFRGERGGKDSGGLTDVPGDPESVDAADQGLD